MRRRSFRARRSSFRGRRVTRRVFSRRRGVPRRGIKIGYRM